jgi:hypothetical protein
VDLTHARWHKSSFSNANGGNNCVEVAFLPEGAVALRDSKNRSATPHVFTAEEWTCFIAGVQAGEFDPR